MAVTSEMNKDKLFMSPYVKEDATIIYKYIQPALEKLYGNKKIEIKPVLDELNNNVKNLLAQ